MERRRLKKDVKNVVHEGQTVIEGLNFQSSRMRLRSERSEKED